MNIQYNLFGGGSETYWLFVEYSRIESKKSFWIGSIGAESHKEKENKINFSSQTNTQTRIMRLDIICPFG